MMEQGKMIARMEHSEDLTYNLADIHGFTPDPQIIGDMVQHTGNLNQYVITGFVWLGATDEWGFKHQAIFEIGVDIIRPLSHLYGTRHTGHRRFSEWEAYSKYEIRE